MEISRRNPEGYPDPTPHEALTNILKEKKFMPLVYICSPYRGEREKNEEKARMYSRVALQKNCIPFAPHLLYPQFMDEDVERSKALYMGKVMLDKCAEVWVFGDNITAGMKGEIERARSKKKTLRYFTADGEEKKNG